MCHPCCLWGHAINECSCYFQLFTSQLTRCHFISGRAARLGRPSGCGRAQGFSSPSWVPRCLCHVFITWLTCICYVLLGKIQELLPRYPVPHFIPSTPNRLDSLNWIRVVLRAQQWNHWAVRIIILPNRHPFVLMIVISSQSYRECSCVFDSQNNLVKGI